MGYRVAQPKHRSVVVNGVFEAGSQVGPYRVERLLGRGGMGCVYLAEHLLLRRRVALKTVAAEFFGDAEMRERFLRECRIVATIDHRNVIPIYDAAEMDGLAFVAMRHVDGTDLKGLIEREGNLRPEEALAIVDQVGSALDAAHQHSVVHRDVKPANILVEGADGRVFLADFGIATQFGAPELTGAGLFLGTIDYCAPEQIEGKEVGPAADIYALGCVLFQSLTGRRPFERETDVAVFHAHLLDPPPSLLSLRPDLPTAFEDVISKVLAKAPEQRYASCRALVDAARAAVAGGRTRPAPRDAAAVAAPAPATPKLPVPPTRLLGRGDEAESLSALLRSPDGRLVTIAGPAGSGKSRLALEVATALVGAFEDVFLVELAAVREPRLVPAAVAEALGIEESREEPLLEAIRARFAESTALLVLDNFEHVIEAAPFVAGVVAAAPTLKILVTTQAALRVRGEHELVLSPLPVPEEPGSSGGTLGAGPAVELFVERAREVDPDFELTAKNVGTVVEICRRLDGLPLAIELAATRVRLLSPEAIVRHLDERFELLTGGDRDAPERHRTLRRAIDWSYELLDEDERRLFARLGVFVGRSTFETVAAVCADPEVVTPGELLELLVELVDQNLVLSGPGPDGEPRFSMLESIRLYALDRLAEEGRLNEFRDRHAERFLAFVEAAEPELTRAGQAVWSEQLSDQTGNVRAALGWLLESRSAEAAARMASALTRFWSMRGLSSEGRGWLRSVLEFDGLSTRLRAKSLFAAGYLTLDDDNDDAKVLFEEALPLARLGEDTRLEAAVLAQIAWILSAASPGDGAGDDGADAARTSLELARSVDDAVTASAALNVLGQDALRTGDEGRSRALYEESLALRRALGDARLCANSLLHLGGLALSLGDRKEAIERYEEGLALARTIGDTWGTSLALAEIAGLHLLEGSYVQAETLAAEALAIAKTRGGRREILTWLQQAGGLLVARGDAATAARVWGAADAQLRAFGALPSQLEGLLRVKFEPAGREALGDGAFEAEVTAGAALGLHEAIALAQGHGARQA
ncbi:MAG: protein kinase domain-containing protein [Verrucomicrobiota bacterium]